jgi:predicted phage terminase large subunit-like protein
VNTIDHYAREILVGYSFRGDKVTGDKAFRAAPLSSAAEAGNVKLLLGAWVEDFLDEAEAFPDSRHKDQVDAVSGAVNALTQASGPVDGFVLL